MRRNERGCLLTGSASIRASTHCPDDGGNKGLWNVGKLLPGYIALQPTRQASSKILYASFISPTRSSFPIHIIVFNLIATFGGVVVVIKEIHNNPLCPSVVRSLLLYIYIHIIFCVLLYSCRSYSAPLPPVAILPIYYSLHKRGLLHALHPFYCFSSPISAFLLSTSPVGTI